MAVEEVEPQSFRQDLVDAGIVIQTEDLWKTYEMGTEQLHALAWCQHRDPQRRVRRHHGTFRLRKIHADEFDRLSRFTHEGKLLARRPPGQPAR